MCNLMFNSFNLFYSDILPRIVPKFEHVLNYGQYVFISLTFSSKYYFIFTFVEKAATWNETDRNWDINNDINMILIRKYNRDCSIRNKLVITYTWLETLFYLIKF